MKDDNTLNLNQFLSLENHDGSANISADLDDIDDIETYLLNHRDFSQITYNFDTFNQLKYQNEHKPKKKKEDQNYRPKLVRGKGIEREGFCDSCQKWFRLKTSSYWYHMNYKHGINSKGKKYPEPILRQNNQKIESFCSICDEWIIICGIRGRKSVKYSWFRHFQKTHNDEIE